MSDEFAALFLMDWDKVEDLNDVICDVMHDMKEIPLLTADSVGLKGAGATLYVHPTNNPYVHVTGTWGSRQFFYRHGDRPSLEDATRDAIRWARDPTRGLGGHSL